MSSTDATDKNLVGFLVDGIQYAVSLDQVREIINPLSVVPLPHSPDYVAGVADYRGQVVPVIDLRQRFALPPAAPTRRTKWIVLNVDRAPIGFIVDEVVGVFGSGRSATAMPPLGLGDAKKGLASVCRTETGLAFILDVHRVAEKAYALRLDSVSPKPSTPAGILRGEKPESGKL